MPEEWRRGAGAGAAPMDPLAHPPQKSPTLRLFASHFGLRPEPESPAALEALARAFARMPYENLTKIIRSAEASADRVERLPHDVVAEHVAFGSGGTCFSLTAALLHLVRALGWRAEPILADRHYGADTHCALIVWLDRQPHLLDPGYLIVRPVPLGTDGETRVDNGFNEVILTPQAGERIDLSTEQDGSRSHRLTFKAAPADPAQFLNAWRASFDWDMMRYPVLTRIAHGEHLYVQDRRWRRRGRDRVERDEIALEALPQRLAQDFGINETVVRRALDILRRKGELDGDA